jgi:peptide chain release factor
MQTILYFSSDSSQRQSALVLAQVLKKFFAAADSNGFKAQVLHKTLGNENNSLVNAFVSIDIEPQSDFLKNWLGTIRWIGTNKSKTTGANNATKETSWFVGISLWSQHSTVLFDLADVQIQTMRSSGAGGQHVNKVSTAVRATHVPTGIQVSASDTRSQYKNKALALDRLSQKVQEFQWQALVEKLKGENEAPSTFKTSKVVKTFRGSDFKKEPNKKPIKKERQRAKIDIKKLFRA